MDFEKNPFIIPKILSNIYDVMKTGKHNQFQKKINSMRYLQIPFDQESQKDDKGGDAALQHLKDRHTRIYPHY